MFQLLSYKSWLNLLSITQSIQPLIRNFNLMTKLLWNIWLAHISITICSSTNEVIKLKVRTYAICPNFNYVVLSLLEVGALNSLWNMIITPPKKQIITDPNITADVMAITDKPMNNTYQNETAVFVTKEVPRVYNTPKLAAAPYVLGGTSDIADFLKRPVEILNISPTSPYFFDPWTSWMNNTAIIAKLRNYALFRGTICLRFMTNAQPFWYGRYIIYQDFGYAQSTTPYTNSWQSSWSCDYKAFLDLAVDQAVELRIPWMSPNNWNVTTPITPVGGVNVYPVVAPLDAQTGSSVSPTIKIYAWLENLELAVPVAQAASSANITVGSVPVEQSHGIISAPLTAVSQISSVFGDAPLIGGAAKTLASITSKLGAAAAVFGFSRPASVQDKSIFIYKTAGDMAITEGIDSSYKLTMDPKHFKSMDPRTADGSSYDPLAIGNIIGRYGFLAQPTALCTSPVGTVVAQYRNHPGHMINQGTNFWQPTPLCYGSLLFSKWTGSIIYKFSIVCSRFHRGRLAIYWNNTTPSEPVANLTNVVFLEVGPGNEAELIVPYYAARPTLCVAPTSVTNNTPNALTDNGYVFITVDQQINCPSTAASISIIVTVRAGPDFQLGAPTNSYMRYINDTAWQNTVTSNDMLSNPVTVTNVATGQYGLNTFQQASPTGNLEVTQSSLVSVSPYQSDYIKKEVFGEGFDSYRNLMKRYNFFQTYTASSTSQSFNILALKRVPTLPSENIAGTYYNASPTVLQYLSRLFLFFSGSTRIKMVPINNNFYSNATVARGWFGTSGTYNFTSIGNVNYSSILRNFFSPSASGVTVQPLSGIIEAEIPDMSGYRMLDCSLFSNANQLDGVTCCMETFTPSSSLIYDIYYAAGEDFNFYVFRGVPTLYYNIPNYG